MTGLMSQILPIAFNRGIDTKMDPKQQVIGVLRQAKNVVFETISSIKKRNGYDQITLKDLDGNRINSTEKLSHFKNELVIFANDLLYSFSEAVTKVVDKGPIYATRPTSVPVLNNSYNHNCVDCLYLEGLKVFVYQNSSLNEVRYSVQDAATGSFLVSDKLVDTGTSFVRVASINNIIYVIYSISNFIYYKRFDIFSPQNLGPQQALANNLAPASPLFDAFSTSSKIIIAYNSSVVGTSLRLVSILSNGTVGGGIGVSGTNPIQALDLLVDSSSRVVVSFADSTDMRYVIVNFALTTVLLPPTSIETIANVRNATTVEVTPGNYGFYYEILQTATYDHYIKHNTGNTTGVVGVATIFVRSLGLAAKSFIQDGTIYVPTVFDTPLQSTYFILNSAATAVSKISPDIGGGLVTKGVVPRIAAISTAKILFPSLVKGKLVADNGTFFSLLGINGTTIDFEPLDPYQNSVLFNNLHVAAGILQMYDGESVVEHGFHMWPEILMAGATATTGGFLSNGNRAYVAVYRWTDNFGQDHRSVPSDTLTVILAGGTATQTQAVVVPTLRLTEKQNVVIELYRTENNGSIYYLVTSPTNPNFNDPTIDSITIVDSMSDADLISKELLYTTGGAFDNTAAPSSSVIAVHTASNRIFLAGLENRNVLQYSQLGGPGFPVSFNDALTIPIDPVGGPITALISMDEKLIIFEQDALFFISGLGPNNLGQQDTFSLPEKLSTEIGCIQPSSVILTPAGVMFKSRKGIYLLNHGMGLEYIGAPAQQFNDLYITSAKVISDFNQVRFTTSDGDCLVYNYFLKLWATFDNHEALSAEVLNNDYYYVRLDGTVFKENRTSFADNGSAIRLLIETGWMSFNGIQGFQRVYRMLILGDYKSRHMIRVRAAYDFNEAYVQEKIISPNPDFITPTTYGEDSPYGSGSPYGGDGNVLQARFDFKKQKCQSIKILIEDQQTVAGEGLSFSLLTLEIGGKKGAFKLNSNRKFGTR